MSLGLRIDSTEWRVVGDDRSWLKAELTVNGVSMHLDAIEVIGDALVQDAVGAAAPNLAQIHEAVGADGGWDTLPIAGRDYVLIATPFC